MDLAFDWNTFSSYTIIHDNRKNFERVAKWLRRKSDKFVCDGSTPSTFTMRVWYKGCASAFQADDENSSFSTRSNRRPIIN